jgi:hypothetical protein
VRGKQEEEGRGEMEEEGRGEEEGKGEGDNRRKEEEEEGKGEGNSRRSVLHTLSAVTNLSKRQTARQRIQRKGK